ncbi:GNAT family N-acetyltransferase [Taklimakanibacter deserti]|uniref:GNAT family N-acetyltransferase n=1 Tax=Taklimakanibacter deserti TaxID=2267839 RepID=UPI000E657786
MDAHARAIVIRKAQSQEGKAIRALVLTERMRPIDLKPENFLVAVKDEEIIGTVQMRRHPDGTRELGSLVVAPPWRRQGIATRLIDELLKDERQSVYMITARAHWAGFARWGFARVSRGSVPKSIRLHHFIGSLGSIVSLLKRRSMRRLVILKRAI